MQAKLLAHYLSVNIAVYEELQGKIEIPDTLLPKLGANPPPGDGAPAEHRTVEIIEEMTKRFIGEAAKSTRSH